MRLKQGFLTEIHLSSDDFSVPAVGEFNQTVYRPVLNDLDRVSEKISSER